MIGSFRIVPFAARLGSGLSLVTGELPDATVKRLRRIRGTQVLYWTLQPDGLTYFTFSIPGHATWWVAEIVNAP